MLRLTIVELNAGRAILQTPKRQRVVSIVAMLAVGVVNVVLWGDEGEHSLSLKVVFASLFLLLGYGALLSEEVVIDRSKANELVYRKRRIWITRKRFPADDLKSVILEKTVARRRMRSDRSSVKTSAQWRVSLILATEALPKICIHSSLRDTRQAEARARCVFEEVSDKLNLRKETKL